MTSSEAAHNRPAPKKVRDSQSELSELVLPNDANGLGDLLGGKLMHLMDVAGSLAAARHARTFVVTASFDHMNFLAPVRIGDLLLLYSSVNRAFRTSMEVGVKAYAENLRSGERRHVASAYLTFVALDGERRPTPAPLLEPETDEERRRYDQAGKRRAYRLQLRR